MDKEVNYNLLRPLFPIQTRGKKTYSLTKYNKKILHRKACENVWMDW
jgi:hypothetical protein